MSKAKKRWGLALVIIVVLVISGIYLNHVNIPVLEPKGPIADAEFRLILIVTGLMLIVVIPVFVLLAYIVYRYNDANPKKAKYSPDWDSNLSIEAIWWLIPTVLIIILSVITWHSTYALNPYKPIPSKNKTITIQVISMDWKWLFIYPEFKLASVNQIAFPVNTPVHFYITSAAPMNSLWIPQLSGQIYAMAGMRTQLYIMANKLGSYTGWSANISGVGFDSMVFKAEAMTKTGFATWVKHARSAPALTTAAYLKLAKPSSFVPVHYYSRPVRNLFNGVILTYMLPKFEQRKLGIAWIN